MKRIFIFLLCIIALVFIVFSWNKISNLLDRRRKAIKIENIIRHFPFTKENSLKEWEEKILKGRVVYKIEKFDTLESYVRAESEKAASALYYKVNLNIRRRPFISWKWRVDEFPKRKLSEKIDLKSEEDFAARIYVIFPAVFFTRSKVVEYIWAEDLPVGSSGTSAYSKNIKILVLRKGSSEEWFPEERDICKDYVELFGEEPRLDIGAIAFMTDADSTKTNASAVYDDISIGYKNR